MSKISLAPDASGTGIFTIASPGTSTNRTLTLPDDTGTIVTNSGNQAGSFTTLNTSGAVVFNDAGADVDFRVEGDTNANLIVADAGVDKVGIGTNTFNTNGGVLQVSNGISFPATQSACADANTLDDYEEGTWTPVMSGSTTAGAGTYNGQAGNYRKIGSVVYYSLDLSWTAHTGTGNMNLSGLPFLSNFVYCAAAIRSASGLSYSASNYPQCFPNVNATTFSWEQFPVGGGFQSGIPMDTAGAIMVTGFYFV